MPLRSRVAAVVAAVLVMVPLGAQSVPAQAGSAPYRSGGEVRAVGLSAAQQEELQRAVDAELSARGGKQIAPNKILWADGSGDTTVPYPGQRKVEGDWQTCEYGNFCVYSNKNFNGSKYSFYNCQFYPFTMDFFSWVNNQTGHTVATMHWDTGDGADYTPGAWAIEDYWNGYSYSGITPC